MSKATLKKSKRGILLLITFLLLVSFLVFSFYGGVAKAGDFNIYNSWHLAKETGLNRATLYQDIKNLTGKDILNSNDKDVVVAVIDSGLDINNSFFTGALWTNPKEIADNGVDDDGNGIKDDINGVAFKVNGIGSGDFSDCMVGGDKGNYYHGTHVAGIIHSIAPNIKIMPIMAGYKMNDKCSFSEENVISSILYAVDNGAKIINMSLGSARYGFVTDKVVIPYRENAKMSVMDAIDYAVSNDVLVVCAGGNNSANTTFYPASLANVVGVMASNIYGNRWISESGAGSNYNDTFDVYAPGADIISTIGANYCTEGLPNGFGVKSGTSMATPYVAGVAGLLMSCTGLGGNEIKSYITNKEYLTKIAWNDTNEKNLLLDHKAIVKILNAIKNINIDNETDTSIKETIEVFDNQKLVLSIDEETDGEVEWWIDGVKVNEGRQYTFIPKKNTTIELRVNGEVIKIYEVICKSYAQFVGIIAGSVIGGLVLITIVAVVIVRLKFAKK